VLEILSNSFETSWPIMLILLLFIYIFAVLAMQLFGNTLNTDPYIRCVMTMMMMMMMMMTMLLMVVVVI
jgi:hypothetical protein